jgi:hypothetical protein
MGDDFTSKQISKINSLLSSDLVRSPAAERVCLEAIRMGTLRRGPPSSSGSSLVYVFTTASGFLTYVHSMKDER